MPSSRKDIMAVPESTGGNPIISQQFDPLLLLSLGTLWGVVTFHVLVSWAGPILMPLLMNRVTLGESSDILAFSFQMTPSLSTVIDCPSWLFSMLANKTPCTQLNIKYQYVWVSL